MSTTAAETYDPVVDKPVEDLLKRAAARAEKSLADRNNAILLACACGAPRARTAARASASQNSV